jgi:site-specific recombinase XerD
MCEWTRNGKPAASTGYKLANDGHDTRAIQHYLGHRSIASTARYTALAPDRFKGFWKD